jgi:hypothetical protein
MEILLRAWKKRTEHPFTAHLQRVKVTTTISRPERFYSAVKII